MAVLYGLALVLLLDSGINGIGKVLGIFVLVLQFWRIWKNPTPESRYAKLEYLNKQWFLTPNEGTARQEDILLFTRHRVLVEAGLFFLLQLSSDKSQKIIVIFFDQILADDYRVLRILQKIN